MTELRSSTERLVSPLGLRRSLALLGSVVAASALVLGAALLVVSRVQDAQPLVLVAWLAPGHALAVLVVLALLLRHWRLAFADLGFRRPTPRLLHLVWQIPLMLVVVLAVQAVATAVIGAPPQRSNAVEDLVRSDVRALVPVAAVGIVVLVPIWEEAVFRGVVLGGLLRRAPAWAAVTASSLLFAAAHAVPLLLPYLFAAGVCLALLARFHRTLWASVIAHASLNGLVLLASLAAVGGP